MGTKLAITIVAAGVWSSALHFRARLRGAVLVMNAIMRVFVIWVPPACAGVLAYSTANSLFSGARRWICFCRTAADGCAACALITMDVWCMSCSPGVAKPWLSATFDAERSRSI